MSTVAITHPQAITGLGGVGKTQIALEYAYRHYSDYQAVLWVRADTRETLLDDYVSIAHLLSLPEKEEQDQVRIIHAVKRWFHEHIGWFLILDNADNLQAVQEFLPTLERGHVLLTTRASTIGPLAYPMETEVMEPAEGTLFVLRRAGLLAPHVSLDEAAKQDRLQAAQIVEVMGGLPLALDQAGAYIQETRCSLLDYLNLYKNRHTDLLKRGTRYSSNYQYTVATTWSLSFQQVEEASTVAAEMLRLCAFLHPDTIPGEIFVDGGDDLGPVLGPATLDKLTIDRAIEELLNYSLVRYRPETKTFSIHRLVQRVLRDAMDQEQQHQWAVRIVRTLNRAFPEVEVATWPQWQRLLPQAQAYTDLIEQYRLMFPEAAQLLNKTAYYLRDRVQFAETVPLIKRALLIQEQALGADHPETATSMNYLAELYSLLGQYSNAEPLMKRALAIRERVLGDNHSDTAESLNYVGGLYRNLGRYEQAESLMKRALVIRERVLGDSHRYTAQSFNSLAWLYRLMGKYEEAEPLAKRALMIWETGLGPMHPETAVSLNNLAELYRLMGKYEEAEPLYKRALYIREQVLGVGNFHTATSLNNLALLFRAQGKYEQAEILAKRAMVIWEQGMGPEHAGIVDSLNNLGDLYTLQGKYTEAEPLLQKALTVREKALGPNHPEVARTLTSLGNLYCKQGKYAESESLLQRAVAIREKIFKVVHPDLAESLASLAETYKKQDEYTEAEHLLQRALALCQKALGLRHPDVVKHIINLGDLYVIQEKYTEATSLYQRTLMTCETVLGEEHPHTLTLREKHNVLLQRLDWKNTSSE